MSTPSRIHRDRRLMAEGRAHTATDRAVIPSLHADSPRYPDLLRGEYERRLSRLWTDMADLHLEMAGRYAELQADAERAEMAAPTLTAGLR